MLKIAFAHPYTFRIPRGTEKVFISLANQLASMGHNVTHLTRKTKRRQNVFPIAKNVKTIEIPTFRYYESLTTIPFYFFEYLKGRYDLVVIAFAKYGEGIPLWLASKLIGTKYVVRFAYSFEFQPNRYKEFDFPPIGNNANGLLAVSRVIADGVERHFNRKCHVLPQAVDTNKYEPGVNKVDLRSKLGLPSDANIILSISAIEERKGIQHAIEMLPQLLEKHPNTYLLIVGHGPYLSELKILSVRHNVKQNVIFYGHQNKVLPFYQTADLFLVFSDFEPNPNTMYESLSCETPVLTSPTGCFPEIVNREWGKMVNPKNTFETAEEISKLFSDMKSLELMGEKGREFVKLNHTWENMAREFIAIVTGI